MSGPLADVKVVEMGVWVAGPAAGAILADWGADVVKIEPTGIGDPARLFSRVVKHPKGRLRWPRHTRGISLAISIRSWATAVRCYSERSMGLTAPVTIFT